MDNKSFYERTGAILIVICAVALIGALAYSFYLAKTNSVQDVTVKVVVAVDSTGVITQETAQAVADLKEELTRHEQLLEDRYQHLLAQKEDMNDLLSIGGMFLAAILGIFGFFGYKSINNIEEKAEKEARLTAEKTSRDELDVMRKGIESRMTDKMQTQVQNAVSKKVAEQTKASKQQIDASINEKVKDSIQDVSDMKETVAGFRQSLENLDQKIADARGRLDALEAQKPASPRGRRTLANGGKEG